MLLSIKILLNGIEGLKIFSGSEATNSLTI